MIDSRLYIETPLMNKKITLLLSARSSYSNWLLHSMPDIDLMNSSARFYDANAFLTYNLNSNNKIHLFAYISNDQFGFSKTTDYHYSNLLGSLRWKHTITNKLYFNLAGHHGGMSSVRCALTGISPTDLSAANIESTIQSAPQRDLVTGAGLGYRCNGQASPPTPAVCTRGALRVTLDAKGKPVLPYTAFGTSPIPD